MQTNPRLQAVRALIKRHQFVTALVVVVALTGVMTGLSMWLYIQSGASGLDLSRPGFTDARSDLQQETTTTFSSTGSLTEADVTAFKKQYDKQRAVLNSLSDFDDEAMSDEELGLLFTEKQPTSE